MKSDIDIAQEAKMEPIIKIAESIGLNEDEIDPVSYTHLDVYKRQLLI